MNRIAEFRKKSGFSQAELAAKVGIAQNTLSQYERGIRTPKHDTILKISDFLNVYPHALYGNAEWKDVNYKFALDTANAFALLYEFQYSEEIPERIKEQIWNKIPDISEICNQLPDLIANIVTASMVSGDATDIASIIEDSLAGKNISENDAAKLLLYFFNKLNEKGRAAAIERVVDLTDIQRYRKATNTPELSEK